MSSEAMLCTEAVQEIVGQISLAEQKGIDEVIKAVLSHCQNSISLLNPLFKEAEALNDFKKITILENTVYQIEEGHRKFAPFVFNEYECNNERALPLYQLPELWAVKLDEIDKFMDLLSEGSKVRFVSWLKEKVEMSKEAFDKNEITGLIEQKWGGLVVLGADLENNFLVRDINVDQKFRFNMYADWAKNIVDWCHDDYLLYLIETELSSIDAVLSSIHKRVKDEVEDKLSSMKLTKDQEKEIALVFGPELSVALEEKLGFVHKKIAGQYLHNCPEFWLVNRTHIEHFYAFLPTLDWQASFVEWLLEKGGVLDAVEQGRLTSFLSKMTGERVEPEDGGLLNNNKKPLSDKGKWNARNTPQVQWKRSKNELSFFLQACHDAGLFAGKTPQWSEWENFLLGKEGDKLSGLRKGPKESDIKDGYKLALGDVVGSLEDVKQFLE